MKKYRNYLDNISVDAELHERTMKKLMRAPKPFHQRRVYRYAGMAACAALVLVCVLALPSLFNNSIIDIPVQYPDQRPNNAGVTPSGPPAGVPIDPIDSLAGQPVDIPAAYPEYALIFNVLENTVTMSASRPVTHNEFSHELTGEQFSAVFPNLAIALDSARAVYFEDGTLIDVRAFSSESWLQINVAEGRVSPGMLVLFEEEPQVSYVRGIAVTTIVIDDYFQAEFMFDGIGYHISFRDSKESGESGQARMTELVNALIKNGAADLSVLADPVIPELRNETLTLEEARNDPGFGALMPQNIPDRFNFDSARRVVDQSTNGLFANWSAYPAFDNIFWSISKVTAHDRERIVSSDEREKFDLSLYPIPWAFSVPEELREFVMNPVFIAEELTLDAIQARALSDERRGGLQIVNFGVLHGDVIINISADGLSPKQVWEMLAELT